MSKDIFIQECLDNPPSELVEDLGAVSHETREIPDPRILIIKNGQILRLDGIPVDDSVEKESYLGKLEYAAFVEIKKWANENEEGVELWFSPPFPPKYPICKVDIGEICYVPDGTKILLKRAILLNIGPEIFLSIANSLLRKKGKEEINNVEGLRVNPIFGDTNLLAKLLNEISAHTKQVELVETDKDLEIKTATYKELTQIEEETTELSIYPYQYRYSYTRDIAQERGLIGNHNESCAGSAKTAFEAFSQSGTTASEGKFVQKCGNCGMPINTIISKGYRCSNCGGTYEGC